MRIRTIKPEWLDDERLALASSDARTLSIALILLADDYGNGRANPVVLGSRVFPGKVPETLAKALEELASLSFVVLYEVDGQRYFSIRNWTKHQKVDKPGKPQVPGFVEQTKTLAKVPESPAKILGSLATDQDQDQYQERESARAHTREVPKVIPETPMDTSKFIEVMEPLHSQDPILRPRDYLLDGFRKRYRAARGFDWDGHGRSPDPTPTTRWLWNACQAHGVKFEEAADDILDRWFAEDWPRANGFPWRTFCKQLPRYVPSVERKAGT